MTARRHPASPLFDRILVAAGLLLLVGAIVWLTWLIRNGAEASMDSSVPAAMIEVSPVGAQQHRLEDEDFGVVLKGRALRRIVQMLQWREVASMPLALDDEIVVDEGEYQMVWSERLMDSSRFALPERHINPPAPPYRSRSIGADKPAWGDPQQGGWQAVPAAQVQLPENLAAVFRSEGQWLVTAADGALPGIGDLRVRFEVLPAPETAPPASGMQTSKAPVSEDPLDQALRWIARAAAFVMAMLGAGLGLRGLSRLSSAGSALGSMRSGAMLAVAAWIAVAAVLLSVGIARLA
ncbi:TMEM43 family protein [Xanthomonadaceae bacterium JHOS43]|nr:TMEM43 family protein [Xanthomonadaceae bacterium JHOS43]MCX7562681.1 TMEM43 family protein [Xanthomonadaceae bacterium XH05]